MLSLFRPALVLFGVLSVVTGVVYPLAVTGVAQLLFPAQANGSLIVKGGAVVGSSLIGQDFSGDVRFFWGRLSATSPVAYTAFNAGTLTGSTGSNVGPSNPALLDSARARIDALRDADIAAGYRRPDDQKIPVDLVTASGSGLDPHISLAAAEYQLPRVARARGMTEDQLRELVRAHTDKRQLGFLGEPVVNVVELNLALDAAKHE